MRKTFLTTASAILVFLTVVEPARAGGIWVANGPALNGWTQNGTKLNGGIFNGLTVNGGIWLPNGPGLNGVALKSSNFAIDAIELPFTEP
jgi:hypothetical protein